VNLMKSITEAVSAAESEEIAVAGPWVLQARLGWVGDSEARNDVLFALFIRRTGDLRKSRAGGAR
jgi:hypothetical protein